LLLPKPTAPFLALQTSIQSFGAFVDIGAEAQGLIHVSQLAVSGAPVTAAAAAASAAAG
jgi:DNA-directed RNA polymerase subunit E'/Rpb7